MKADLIGAKAAVDWTIAQFPALLERVDAWAAVNVEMAIRHQPAPATHDLIVAFDKEPLPLSLNVEVGAYLNVLRSALDILAMALRERHRVLFPEEVYFPVANSAEDFAAGNYKGSKFVAGLPADERLIVESLKPYRGGHVSIWHIHNLDIMRKHRRLLRSIVTPTNFKITGAASLEQDFTPVIGGYERANGETVFGRLRKGASNYQADATLQVAFDEPGLEESSVVSALMRFAEDTNGIIAKFDF